MLVFVAKPDEFGFIRKSRMIIPEYPTTTELMKKISSFYQLQPNCLIAKLKHHPTNVPPL
jgi:hypothetical protein